MNSNKITVKILITDYDKCALAPKPNGREDLLSNELIEIAKKNNYAGFYGCTHRCVATTLINIKFYTEYLLHLLKYNMNPLNAFTISVTSNLADATGLKCFGVSTPDDDSFDAPQELSMKCGFGFTQLIKEHEEKIISGLLRLQSANDNIFPPFQSKFKPIDVFNSHDKNGQLIKIMHQARALIPEHILEFHYLDDALDLCEKVKDIKLVEMPKDVVLKSYQHCDSAGITANLENPVCSISSIISLRNTQQNLFADNNSIHDSETELTAKDVTVCFHDLNLASKLT